jgi:hypothetical protein
MPASLKEFGENPSGVPHGSYAQSVLAPVAPEYSTGEVLVAATYRRLLTGESDAAVDLEDIPGLPNRLAVEAAKIDSRMDAAAFKEAWEELVLAPGGLASPSPRGQQATRRLRQLMPLVPEISRVAGVLGRVRQRWQPGNLLISALWSGKGPELAPRLLERLRNSLMVGRGDDYLAQFVEYCLKTIQHIRPDGKRATPPELQDLVEDADDYLPAWRPRPALGHLPAERFTSDLEFVLDLKGRLTRRQWVVLLESVIRLGLGMHQLWLTRLNVRVWQLCLKVCTGVRLSTSEVSDYCWSPQEPDEPLLQLAENSVPALRRLISEYAQARIGINLLLFVLDEAAPWKTKIGQVSSNHPTPADAVAAFLQHAFENRDKITSVLADKGYSSLVEGAGTLADAEPRFLSGQKGLTRNLSFFFRYGLGQLQPVDDTQRQYDQGYLLYKQDRRGEKWIVQPAPAMLLVTVHCCCRSRGSIPASIEHLRAHLAAHGIGASADELRSGGTARELQRLGLVVESPDAGGGRLLVDPLLSRPIDA